MFEVSGSAPAELTLAGEANIHTARELYRALRGVLDRDEPVTLDLGGLTEVDLAGLQVLLAFARVRGPDRVLWRACPPWFRRRVQVTGLGGWLQV